MFLHEDLIRQHLQHAGFHDPVKLHVLATVDSTNQYLKELPLHHTVELCCAETQTQGRGRFQRTWFSPEAENIYCSIRWQFSNPISQLSPLGLVISIAILQTLQTLNIAEGIAIKWPNDLLWNGKKLCGILLESGQYADGHLHIIVGIGLNVNSDSTQPPSLQAPDRPWCSLYDITQRILDRNILIAQLLVHTQQAISLFKTNGFEPFLPFWNAADYLQGQTIRVLHANHTIRGIARGITPQGELIVIDANQQQWRFVSGETSIEYSL